jgi:hypothetical protein
MSEPTKTTMPIRAAEPIQTLKITRKDRDGRTTSIGYFSRWETVRAMLCHACGQCTRQDGEDGQSMCYTEDPAADQFTRNHPADERDAPA